MRIIDKLERKLGRFAIPNLMMYIIVLYVIGFVIWTINPEMYINHLCLNAQAIFQGEIWRIVTFLMFPPADSMFMMILLSVIYYSLGHTLETIVGTFRFNLYIGIGVFGYVFAALIIYLIWGQIFVLTAGNLYLSLLLLMAMLFPDTEFLLFFVIPIKAKWLGLAYIGMEIYSILTSTWPEKIAIFMSLLNVIVFFVYIKRPAQQAKQVKRKVIYQSQVQRNTSGPRHRCAICGRTELDVPDMEFRYCSKCEGSYEYCQDHLYTHVHVTGEKKPE